MPRTVRGAAILALVGAFALALAGSALAVKSGVWDGTTNQIYRLSGDAMPFSLEVSHNKVIVVYYGGNWSGNSALCMNADGPDAQRLSRPHGFRGFSIKHNRFGGKVTVFGTEHVSIRGQFKGKKLSGSLTDSFKTGPVRCSTGKVTFSAKPGHELI